MKRLIPLLLLLCVLALAGCQKNNDLVGTKWMTKGYDTAMRILVGGTWYKWYDFMTNEKVYCYWTDASGNVIRSEGEYAYEYDYPSLSVTDNNGVDKYEFSDKYSFSLVKTDGTLNKSVTYYKQ